MSLDWCRTHPDRCPEGYAPIQHDGGLCDCPGLTNAQLAARGKAMGQARAAAARPTVRAEVDAAIAAICRERPGGTFTANDLDEELRDRASNVMGGAFTAAKNAKLIRDTLVRVPSSLPSTHLAEVRVWHVMTEDERLAAIAQSAA